MNAARAATVLGYLRRLGGAGMVRASSDSDLLERFALGREDAAFAELVRRHGPMVLGVCRRVLGNPHDAEDAFQATFLVLAARPRAVGDPSSLANWLFGVARRTALRLQVDAARRYRHEHAAAKAEESVPAAESVWRDVQPVLDAEVARLPARCREAFVLCCLEGRTQEEAGRLLGCPGGTVASRLSRARERLRWRLTRRGLTLGAAGALFVAGESEAAASSAMLGTLVRAAMTGATTTFSAVGSVSPRVAALTEGVLRAMWITKLKIVAALVLAVGAAGFGTGVVATSGTRGAEQQEVVKPADANRPTSATKSSKSPIDEKQPAIEEARFEVERAQAVLAAKQAELNAAQAALAQAKAALAQRSSDTKSSLPAGATSKPPEEEKRATEPKDAPTPASIQDAEDEVELMKARMQGTQAALDASKKTADEAKTRLERMERLRGKGLTSQEEYEGAKLTADRYLAEVRTREAELREAEIRVRQAQRRLDALRTAWKDAESSQKPRPPAGTISKPPEVKGKGAESKDVPPPASIQDAEDEVELMKARLMQKQAELAAAKVTVDHAKTSLARADQVKAKGGIAAEDYDAVKGALDAATAQMRIKEADLREPEIRLRQAQRRLDALNGAWKNAESRSKPARSNPAKDAQRIEELEKQIELLQKELETIKKR